MKLRYYPDPILNAPVDDVETFDDDLSKFVMDMAETLYSTKVGVGLAAPQVGRSLNLFIMDVSDPNEPDELHVLINPSITASSDAMLVAEEGCLSFPGVVEKVRRHVWVEVDYLNEEGEPQSTRFAGLAAHVVQHEYDHLHEKTLADRVSRQTRRGMLKRVKRALKK
tara:strand:+ start:252576 stop:253076 length:501 start_codon:yes stop_codon:yes gene_type:complete